MKFDYDFSQMVDIKNSYNPINMAYFEEEVLTDDLVMNSDDEMDLDDDAEEGDDMDFDGDDSDDFDMDFDDEE
ncbi:hypothetical protein H6790_00720 [Candidatus Nomurabacteria bacterium]|nr:hypothetical protein [Candidatus Nomurabacteria bacterium]MCB9820456.1 hypothetical protein [Candidatus Nomurabacteria bacterium]